MYKPLCRRRGALHGWTGGHHRFPWNSILVPASVEMLLKVFRPLGALIRDHAGQDKQAELAARQPAFLEPSFRVSQPGPTMVAKDPTTFRGLRLTRAFSNCVHLPDKVRPQHVRLRRQ